MSLALITGSTGLVGSEAVNFFCDKGFDVIGIDNNLRKYFFGSNASTTIIKNSIIKKNNKYLHHNLDIRNSAGIEKIFKKYKKKYLL